MRRLVVLLLPMPVALCLQSSLWAQARAADRYPAELYVVTELADVLSGPGTEYPISEQLQFGDVVEAYRLDKKEWLAIRPPAGAFSWVAATDLQPEPERLATALRDDVPVYVGGVLAGDKRVIQVRLRRKEVVEVLGESVSRGGRHWVKIAPPSGEFRWIHRESVSATFPGLAGATPQRPAGAEHGDMARPSGAVRRQRAGVDQLASPGLGDGANPREAHADWSAPSIRSPDHVERELTRLNIEVSRLLLGEPGGWRLEPLERQVEDLASRSQTASQLSSARELLNRLAKMREIQNLLAAEPLELSGAASGGSAALERPMAAALGYDGLGTLTPVVSRQADAPPYALTDASGEVIYFVTPAPGVNLRRFEGQPVGIHGTRGYMATLQKRHLTARQVTPLKPMPLR